MPDTSVDGYLGGLYFGNGADYAASTTWTEVTKLTEFTPPERTVAKVDISHLKSAEQTKEYKSGWKDSGECTATGHFTATQYATLVGLEGVTKGWRCLFEDDAVAGTHAGGVGFTGFISKIGTPLAADGLVTVSFSIAVTGVRASIAADTTPV